MAAEDRNQNQEHGNENMDNTSAPEEQNQNPAYKLRLFVTGTNQRSQQAIQNIREICEEHLHGQYELEVIDVYQHPDRARSDQILAVPTLLRELPPPLRKVIGDLSEKDKVLAGLDIQPK